MVTHNYGLLEINEARYLADLVGIEHDLSLTIEWCKKYDELFENMDLIPFGEPLTTAILVRFMRAFGGGVRNKSARHLLNALTEEQKAQYDHYRSYRDKHIAHSINEFEDNYVKAYFIEENIEKGINSISTGCSQIIGISTQDTKNIINICNTLLDEVQKEMNAEQEKLLMITNDYTSEDILNLRKETHKRSSEIDIAKGRK